MSISYLGNCTQMKIRPVSDGDILFEMETNDSMTTCCRIETSYDLVVKDVISEKMMFCVNGAEIDGHTLQVYIVQNQLIGTVENSVLKVHQHDDLSLWENKNIFVLQNGKMNIKMAVGLVTLNWSRDFPVEFKALSIAFALHMTLTMFKTTVVDGAGCRTTTPVDPNRYCPLLSPTQPQACPKHNRSRPPPILTFADCEAMLWLLTAGWDHPNKTTVAFLVDKNYRVIMKIRIRSDDIMRAFSIQGLNMDGSEEFLATKIHLQSKSMDMINVKRNGEDIGEITYAFTLKTYNVKCFENEAVLELKGNCPKTPPLHIVDNKNKRYGTIDQTLTKVCTIKLQRSTSLSLRLVLVCTSIYHFGFLMKRIQKLPLVRISRMTCNCDYCQKPNFNSNIAIRVNEHLYMSPKLKMEPAGRNKQKNVIYYNICSDEGGLVKMTLEVTPIKEFQQVAKIEGKDLNGKVIFTSFHHQNIDMFTIYNKNKRLAAYILRNDVYDSEKKLLFAIRKTSLVNPWDEKRFGPNWQFYLNVDGQAISSISSYCRVIQIYRNQISTMKPTFLQVLIEMTLAIKLHSKSFKFDRLPSAEIFYCYRRAKEQKMEDFVRPIRS